MTEPEKGPVNDSGLCLFRGLGRWLGLGFVAILDILQDAFQAFASHFRPGRNFLDVGESVGISRHGEGDENALRRRSSYLRRPRVMRWRSVRAQRSVDRGRAGGAIEPRNSSSSGCRRSANRRKATLLAALSRVAGGPCAVGDPRHARRAPCARTERSRGRP